MSMDRQIKYLKWGTKNSECFHYYEKKEEEIFLLFHNFGRNFGISCQIEWIGFVWHFFLGSLVWLKFHFKCFYPI